MIIINIGISNFYFLNFNTLYILTILYFTSTSHTEQRHFFIPRLRRAGKWTRMLCMCSSVKYLFFSLALQPRWRLVVITRWWGWCPVGTISIVFPSSTDYWNNASSPRPERTLSITSALWNEITQTVTKSSISL